MSFTTQALDLFRREKRCAVVTLARVEGSSPREEQAQMLVTASGILGTIGGGALEWQALAQAQKLLNSCNPAATVASKNYQLGPDLGQCCGGRVTVKTQIIESEAQLLQALTPEVCATQVFLYGAGHIGKSLILLLAQAPFDITWIDPRPGAFPKACPANTRTFNRDDILQPLARARHGSLVIVMSHSHELDFAVVDCALRHIEIAHVLLIGSSTKRARFLSRLKAAGQTQEALSRLICPIGDGTLTGKEPYTVALSTAHQLLALDEALRLGQKTVVTEQERQAG